LVSSFDITDPNWCEIKRFRLIWRYAQACGDDIMK
jgi:hypothetical protein